MNLNPSMNHDPEQLLMRAGARCHQALEILESLQLMDRWSRFGRPKLVGAVRYGLAVAMDIDMDIYSPDPQIRYGFEVFQPVAELPGIWKIRFSNELDRPDQGLYWQVRYRADDGEIWKIDNWLLSEAHPQANRDDRFAQALVQALTTETRMAILRIKETLAGQEGVRGIDIYQAVLEGGARSAEDFLAWQQSHPPEGLNFWLPSTR